MRTGVDIVLAGVGGQGVLTATGILAEAARREGLFIKQGEVHGMAQRGGAVQAMIRCADTPVHSDLIGIGTADMVLGFDPVEALRNIEYLAPGGRLVVAADPFDNIPDYPSLDELYDRIRSIPGSDLIAAGRIAREAGSSRAANVVMIGAASRYLPLPADTIEAAVRQRLAGRTSRVIEANVQAFRRGRTTAAGATV